MILLGKCWSNFDNVDNIGDVHCANLLKRILTPVQPQAVILHPNLCSFAFLNNLILKIENNQPSPLAWKVTIDAHQIRPWRQTLPEAQRTQGIEFIT